MANNELKEFRRSLENLFLTSEEKLSYMDLMGKLVECDQMPVAELYKRAQNIKPIIRLEGEKDTDGNYIPVIGDFHNNDVLYYLRPFDITKSYLKEFSRQMFALRSRQPFKVDTSKLVKVAEFTCYHKCEYQGQLMPTAYEVLTQIPDSIPLDHVDAFELSFDSDEIFSVYDSVLNRHVSNVILYSVKGGLPTRVKTQDIIVDEQRICY